MPKKLAITVAGAVSLGSYEAGVLYEFLDAIAQNNQGRKPEDDGRIVVDVLTGASAGGMTAIILAQKLLYAGDEFKGPYDNPLYNTWVKRITLEGLQDPGDDEPALHSIFSSDLITAISQETLMGRYASGAPPEPVAHLAADVQVQVGVALTNLNGVVYGYDVKPAGRFNYVDYGDQMTRSVVARGCDTAEFWEPLRQAAVACGAFPFAFRAQDIRRSAKQEAGDYNSVNMQPWDRDPQTFTYSDGGILQNQPLGMAKNLVDFIDKHLDQERRFYLFVSPHAKDPEANDSFHAASADYLRLLERLIDVIMGQSGFEDWVTARDVNERIELLDQRAAGLQSAITSGAIDVASLAKTAASLLDLFFGPAKQHVPPGATKPETLQQAQQRIANQYKTEMAALGGLTAQAIAFRDAVLAFETAAGLGARDHMTIYGVIADSNELAGAGLQAFLGFFDQRFRDHDYDVGRTKARAVLANAQQGGLGPIRYTSKPMNPVDSRLDGLKMSHVPVADLQSFKAGARKRLNRLLRELWGPHLALPAIPGSDLILDSILNHLIARM